MLEDRFAEEIKGWPCTAPAQPERRTPLTTAVTVERISEARSEGLKTRKPREAKR